MLDFIIKYLPAVLLFALATMVIYAWGLLKMQQQPKQLASMLYSKCYKRIVKALQREETMSRSEIEKLLKNVRVGQFYSRQRMGVTDPKTFTKSMLEHMQEKDVISVSYKDGKNLYRLNKNVKNKNT